MTNHQKAKLEEYDRRTRPGSLGPPLSVEEDHEHITLIMLDHDEKNARGELYGYSHESMRKILAAPNKEARDKLAKELLENISTGHASK